MEHCLALLLQSELVPDTVCSSVQTRHCSDASPGPDGDLYFILPSCPLGAVHACWALFITQVPAARAAPPFICILHFLVSLQKSQAPQAPVKTTTALQQENGDSVMTEWTRSLAPKA